MRILSRVLLALFVLSVVTSPVVYAVVPPDISFDVNQPVGGKGKITAAGTYSLGVPPHTFVSVTLYARPVGGGTLYSNVCAAGGGSWTGLIATLPAGSYDCWAVMRTTNGGNPVDTSTGNAVVIVN